MQLCKWRRPWSISLFVIVQVLRTPTQARQSEGWRFGRRFTCQKIEALNPPRSNHSLEGLLLGEPPLVDEQRYNTRGPESENKMCMRSHGIKVTKRSLM